MNFRMQKKVLWCATGVAGAAALAAIALAVALPLDLPPRDAGARLARGSWSNAAVAGKNNVRDVWAINLRRPLIDGAPSIAAAPDPQPAIAGPAMPLLHVLGTVIEPNHSVALIEVGGKTQFKSVGDVVGDARIEQINGNGCVVSFNGRSVAIDVQRNAALGAMGTVAARPDDVYGDRR